MPIEMRNCPTCNTIQKVGTNCGICRCPITSKVSSPIITPSLPVSKLTGEDFELESRKQEAGNLEAQDES